MMSMGGGRDRRTALGRGTVSGGDGTADDGPSNMMADPMILR